MNPVGSNGQGYTFFFLFFLIIIIQIPNQVVESFFLINHVIIITKKKKEFGIELDFTMLGPRYILVKLRTNHRWSLMEIQ